MTNTITKLYQLYDSKQENHNKSIENITNFIEYQSPGNNSSNYKVNSDVKNRMRSFSCGLNKFDELANQQNQMECFKCKRLQHQNIKFYETKKVEKNRNSIEKVVNDLNSLRSKISCTCSNSNLNIRLLNNENQRYYISLDWSKVFTIIKTQLDLVTKRNAIFKTKIRNAIEQIIYKHNYYLKLMIIFLMNFFQKNFLKLVTSPINSFTKSQEDRLRKVEDHLVSFVIILIYSTIFTKILSHFVDFSTFHLIIVVLVIGLASFGASFGLRKMYVKALLKIFEYATNIKQEKLKDYEDLIENEITNELQKQKKMAKMHRLRLESFMLNPPSQKDDQDLDLLPSGKLIDEDEEDEELTQVKDQNLKKISDVDEQNNNYISTNQTAKNLNETNQTQNESKEPVKPRTFSDIKRDFQVGDVIDFVNKGLQSIIDDEVTKRFTTEELTVWNLLSRTNQQYEYVSFRVTVLWLFGLLLRYCVLFPFRLMLFIVACFYTFISTFLIGLIPDGRFKRGLNWYASLILHRMLSRVFSAIITFHNRENKAKPGSICVANHTSPIDVIILSTDNCYSMIGQQHSGFTGMMQRAFSRSAKHIWFDRSETKDRLLVARRMCDHVKDKNNMPILIFPEGTCINNTSVMMFKKGCFEVDTTIYPVAIKYDLRFGDAFWNSSKHTMLQYLILMMTSWAIVVDVYYLEKMKKNDGENAADFAARVKKEIAKKGGFVDLNWDGMLKRASPKLDLMYEQQNEYVKHLKIN